MKISQQSVQPDDIAGISVMVSEIMVLQETSKPFDTPFPSSYGSTGRIRLFYLTMTALFQLNAFKSCS